MKKVVVNLILFVAAILILLAGIELVARADCQRNYGVPFFAMTTAEMEDALLGWKGTKIMGDSRTKRMKVFFVGDSFTKGNTDLAGKMFFDIVKHDIDIELFVYGGGGYGSMQEYLVIDKYIDTIKPDLVVLQVSSNDFINNHWDLERRSYIHNNYMARPYYENGKIRYRYPRGPIFLRQYVIPYSRFAYLLCVRIDKKLVALAEKGDLTTVENDIQTKGLALNKFKKSVAVTSEIMKMIRGRCAKTRIIAFSTFNDEPYFTQFRAIFKNLKIDFLEEIPGLAWDAEGRGGVRNNDHWSEKGQQACGAFLAHYIQSNVVIGKQSDP